MAGAAKIFILKLACFRPNYCTVSHVNVGRMLSSSYASLSECVELHCHGNRVSSSMTSMDGVDPIRCWKPSFAPSVFWGNNLFLKSSFHGHKSLSPTFGCGGFSFSTRAYSSTNVNANDGVQPSVSDNAIDVGGSDWASSFNHAYQSVVNASTYASQKVKEKSDAVLPYIQALLDSHPFLKEVIVPVGGTVFGTMMAWLFMPKVLRRLHRYSLQGPTALLYGPTSIEQLPYEKSFWGALEDPLRYLITFMAFSQLAVLIAPTTIAAQYIGPAWRGAVVLSFVWFLHRWKTNFFERALASQSIAALDKDKLLVLDRLSTVGLISIGLMASAEACGVAVQSILTVGGIGGVATAFAARDVLGNMLSGFSIQFTKPFSIGDTIKAGSVEGQVVEMGLTTTSLLNSEKFPIIVPNSLFSSQAIVNKSRAQWRAIVLKIPLQLNDLQKISDITKDVKAVLRSNPNVYGGKEAPYCFLSRIEDSFAELTIGCNLKNMGRDEFYSTRDEVLLEAARIIGEHGIKLGSTRQDLRDL